MVHRRAQSQRRTPAVPPNGWSMIAGLFQRLSVFRSATPPLLAINRRRLSRLQAIDVSKPDVRNKRLAFRQGAGKEIHSNFFLEQIAKKNTFPRAVILCPGSRMVSVEAFPSDLLTFLSQVWFVTQAWVGVSMSSKLHEMRLCVLFLAGVWRHPVVSGGHRWFFTATALSSCPVRVSLVL